MQPSESEQLITPRQLAELLHVTVHTVYQLMKRPGFPMPIRFNRKLVRFRAAAIYRWTREQSGDVQE